MCWFVDVECTRHTYTENGHIKCNCVSLVCRLGIYITELCGNINAAEDTMGTCKPTAYPIHPPHYPFFFLLFCFAVCVLLLVLRRSWPVRSVVTYIESTLQHRAHTHIEMRVRKAEWESSIDDQRTDPKECGYAFSASY